MAHLAASVTIIVVVAGKERLIPAMLNFSAPDSTVLVHPRGRKVGVSRLIPMLLMTVKVDGLAQINRRCWRPKHKESQPSGGEPGDSGDSVQNQCSVIQVGVRMFVSCLTRTKCVPSDWNCECWAGPGLEDESELPDGSRQ